MAATKRYMNTRSVVATPAVGSPATATGITNLSCDFGISLQKFAGDADRGPSTIVQDYMDPTVSFTTADLAFAGAIGVNFRGTLTFVSKDAKSQTSTLNSGDISWTMSNAIVMSNSFNSGFRQFGQANLTFCAEMPDGLTPQIAFTVTA